MRSFPVLIDMDASVGRAETAMEGRTRGVGAAEEKMEGCKRATVPERRWRDDA